MKTSHFEGSIAYCAAGAAQERDERTQRELAALDIDFGGQRLAALEGAAEKALHHGAWRLRDLRTLLECHRAVAPIGFSRNSPIDPVVGCL